MAAAQTRTVKDRKSRPLLDSLKQRLDLLTRTLNEAEISGKSIDIVKEIKELHAILRSLREAESPENPQPLMVVWGGPHMPGGPYGSSCGSAKLGNSGNPATPGSSGPVAKFASRPAPGASGRAGAKDRSAKAGTKTE